MQCEIRAMGDMAEPANRSSDTLPKPGRVNEVQQHYSGNKTRNAQVREDFPCAVDEQKKEEEEAEALRTMYHRMVLQQEEIDAHIAKQLAERIEREELERQRALEEEDEEIARCLQERERLRLEEKERLKRLENEASPVIGTSTSQYHHDINSVGLPLPSEYHTSYGRIDSLSQQLRLCSVNETPVQNIGQNSRDSPIQQVAYQSSSSDLPGQSAYQDEIDPCSPPESISPVPMSEEDARRIQEEQDAELARLLQEQEGLQQCSMLDQDRLMAIEAQDKELARLLQERERAKARRARERAKQRALLKKQQQQQPLSPTAVLSDDEGFAASPAGLSSTYQEWPDRENELPRTPAVRPTDLDLSGTKSSTSRGKQRYPDPEAIEVLPSSPEPGPSHALPNIAMAIDPTYPRRVGGTALYSDTPPSNMSSPAISLPPPDFEDDDSPVPPYMPIQGQRRTASLEKKTKKGRVKKEGVTCSPDVMNIQSLYPVY